MRDPTLVVSVETDLCRQTDGQTDGQCRHTTTAYAALAASRGKSIIVFLYTAGGKKYGQLKAQQQNELDSINQVSDVT